MTDFGTISSLSILDAQTVDGNLQPGKPPMIHGERFMASDNIYIYTLPFGAFNTINPHTWTGWGLHGWAKGDSPEDMGIDKETYDSFMPPRTWLPREDWTLTGSLAPIAADDADARLPVLPVVDSDGQIPADDHKWMVWILNGKITQVYFALSTTGDELPELTQEHIDGNTSGTFKTRNLSLIPDAQLILRFRKNHIYETELNTDGSEVRYVEIMPQNGDTAEIEDQKIKFDGSNWNETGEVTSMTKTNVLPVFSSHAEATNIYLAYWHGSLSGNGSLPLQTGLRYEGTNGREYRSVPGADAESSWVDNQRFEDLLGLAEGFKTKLAENLSSSDEYTSVTHSATGTAIGIDAARILNEARAAAAEMDANQIFRSKVHDAAEYLMDETGDFDGLDDGVRLVYTGANSLRLDDGSLGISAGNIIIVGAHGKIRQVSMTEDGIPGIVDWDPSAPLPTTEGNYRATAAATVDGMSLVTVGTVVDDDFVVVNGVTVGVAQGQIAYWATHTSEDGILPDTLTGADLTVDGYYHGTQEHLFSLFGTPPNELAPNGVYTKVNGNYQEDTQKSVLGDYITITFADLDVPDLAYILKSFVGGNRWVESGEDELTSAELALVKLLTSFGGARLTQLLEALETFGVANLRNEAQIIDLADGRVAILKGTLQALIDLGIPLAVQLLTALRDFGPENLIAIQDVRYEIQDFFSKRFITIDYDPRVGSSDPASDFFETPLMAPFEDMQVKAYPPGFNDPYLFYNQGIGPATVWGK